MDVYINICTNTWTYIYIHAQKHGRTYIHMHIYFERAWCMSDTCANASLQEGLIAVAWFSFSLFNLSSRPPKQVHTIKQEQSDH